MGPAALATMYLGASGVLLICPQMIGTQRKQLSVRSTDYPVLPALLLLALVMLIPAVATSVVDPITTLGTTQILGAGIMILGIALGVWAYMHLGTNWTVKIALREGHTIVDSGPYAYMRHPLYAGVLVAAIGFCLVSMNVFYALSALTFAVAYAWCARYEDRLMEDAFGADYLAYKRRTGALIPKLRRSTAAAR